MIERVVVCMPVFNEGPNVAAYISELFDAFGEHLVLVVVDDCSTDETAGVLRAVEICHQDAIVILRNERNLGHGPSVISALRFACANIPDSCIQVLTADGDGQVSGDELFRFWCLARQAPMVTWEGSRERSQAGEELFRRIASFASRKFVTLVSGKECMDGNTPVRAHPVEVLKRTLSFLPGNGLRLPNLLFSIVSRKNSAFASAEIGWRTRLGGTPVGSTWSNHRFRRVLHFATFSFRGLAELLSLLAKIRREEGLI